MLVYFDATKSFGLKQFGINLDQYSADVTANNNITTSAVVAPTASFETIKPIKQAPPSKPSALGPIMGGFSSGIKTATSLGWSPFDLLCNTKKVPLLSVLNLAQHQMRLKI